MRYLEWDHILAPQASSRVAWLETLLLTALGIGLGAWLSPHDPLLAESAFPWLILAPLLLGVRYGFLHGFASALLIIGALFAFRFAGWAYASTPVAFVVGTLLCGMLIGEFRDSWARRLERLSLANEYRQLRLDKFTRAHHALRISHDQLEQRIAGSEQSLRSSLLELRKRLRDLPQERDLLEASAESILALLSRHTALRTAALYRVSAGRVDPVALASLGDMPALSEDDLLLRMALERKELVSVRAHLLELDERPSVLQLCVPLVDTEGRVLALLAVLQMPFFMFHERNFNLLAILAGWIADLLTSERGALQLDDLDAQEFSRLLRRSCLDVREHGLPASLLAFEFDDEAQAEELLGLIEDSRRGLDVQLRLRNARGHWLLLALLPLTSAQGVQGYQERLRGLLRQRFGAGYQPQLRTYELQIGRSDQAVANFLFHECALNDQQVAV